MFMTAVVTARSSRRNLEATDRRSVRIASVPEDARRSGLFEQISNYLNTTPEATSSDLLVETEKFEFHILGNSMSETLSIHWSWLMKVLRFFLFHLVGVLILSSLEHWSALDSLYFISQSLSTIGYGDILPTNTSTRMFMCFYIFAGILMVFSITADIVHTFVNYMKKKYYQPKTRTKLQMLVRAVLNALMWVAVIAGVVLFGAVVIALNEGLSFQDSFFFAVVTVTTVGYGVAPLVKNSSKVFNMIYITLGVPLTAMAMQKIASLKRHVNEAEREQRLNSIELCDELLRVVSKTERDRVSRSEYVLHMLQLSGRIDADRDILPWTMRFAEFDIDGDGYLTNEDVVAHKAVGAAFAAAAVGVEEGAGKMAGSPETSSSSSSEAIPVPRTKATRRASVLEQVASETKEVILETLKLKSSDNSRSGHPDAVTSTSKSTAMEQILALQAAIGHISSPSTSKKKRVAAAMQGGTVKNVMHDDGSSAIEMRPVSSAKRSSLMLSGDRESAGEAQGQSAQDSSCGRVESRKDRTRCVSFASEDEGEDKDDVAAAVDLEAGNIA